jgi:hypothetical protein
MFSGLFLVLEMLTDDANALAVDLAEAAEYFSQGRD